VNRSASTRARGLFLAALGLILSLRLLPAQPMSGIYPVGSGEPGVDSFASVQAAATALSGRGLAGNVEFPIAQGIYSGAVVLRRVAGSGNYLTRFYPAQVGATIDAGGAPCAFLVESTANVGIEGVRFQDTRDTAAVGLWFRDSDSGTVMRCRFGDSARTGLLVERAERFHAESLRIETPMRGPDSRGIQLRDCRAAYIQRCSLQTALGTGVLVTGGSDNFLGMISVMNASDYGVLVQNSPRLSLMQSVVRNATVSAFRVTGSPGTVLANCLTVGGSLESAYFESCDSLSITSLMLVGSSGRAISVVRSRACALMQLSVQSQTVRGLVLDRSPDCTVDSLQVVNLFDDTAVAVRLDSSPGCAFRFCNVVGHCRQAIALDRSPRVRIMHARYRGDPVAAGFSLTHSGQVFVSTCSLYTTGQSPALELADSSDDDTLLNLIILGSPAQGIAVRDCRNPVIANCFIRGWTGTGIDLEQAQSPRLYFNTVVGPVRAAAAAIRFAGTSDARAADNIIWNPGLDSSACYRIEGAPPFAAAGSDYNDLFASGSSGSVARVNDTLYSALADWQSLPAALDSHSLALDPQLVLNTDYHIAAGSPCRHAGIPVPGVTLDLDGDPRDPSSPDIGADEYRPGAIAEDRPPASTLYAELLGNPARGRCRLSYVLDKAEPVRVRLFDASGRTVLLAPRQEQTAGNHVASLDITSLSPGVYLLELRAGSRIETMKLVLE
jgi:hypothetical protein